MTAVARPRLPGGYGRSPVVLSPAGEAAAGGRPWRAGQARRGGRRSRNAGCLLIILAGCTRPVDSVIRQANRAVAVSAAGLAVTGLAGLLLAVLTGSVGLLGDAIHNLSDGSASAVVLPGFRL
jgi:Co/Zn/Cd efflux system component